MESIGNHTEKDDLHDLIEIQTTPVDIIASWENLCTVYDTLRFVDDINDAMRLEEFKWIVKEMNKHLSRAKTKLMKCEDPESAKMSMINMMSQNGQMNLTSRREIAYQKLKQIWIMNMIQMVESLQMDTMEES